MFNLSIAIEYNSVKFPKKKAFIQDDKSISYEEFNRLTNQLYQTKPCHYHGNGSHNVKVIHNNYCNYLLKQWNPLYQYRIYRKDIRDKIIYLFIYCDGEGYDLSLFFEGLELIDYPKEIFN